MKRLILGIVAGIAAVGGAETVREPARELPLIEDVDVAVVGGGFAAASAALAAKEAGANVFVVMPRQNPGDDIASTRRHSSPAPGTSPTMRPASPQTAATS